MSSNQENRKICVSAEHCLEHFTKPFKCGWKREVVHRFDPYSKTSNTGAEIYYISPDWKKIRTKKEIRSYLSDELDMDMFTFSRKALGVNSGETVRVAAPKGYRGSMNEVILAEKIEPNIPVFGSKDPINNPIVDEGNIKESSLMVVEESNVTFRRKPTSMIQRQHLVQCSTVTSNLPVDEMDQIRQKLQEKDDAILDLQLCLARTEAALKRIERAQKKDEKDFLAKIHESLPMLTPNQIALMTKQKKRVNWTNEEISNGFAHSYFSRRGYNFSIQKLQIPQPSVRTLQKWGENITIAPGVLEDCLVILSGLRNTLTEGESQVMLTFDEMKCKSLYEYNKTLDSIMGPSSHMQTVMVRGLFAKFKQPIFVDFDMNVSPYLIDLLSTKLHKAGFNVVGSICDNGGSNVGLWGRCGVDYENTKTRHPETGGAIFMFSDVPHLLKLLRNWFLDGGFLLEDGTELNQFLIRQLLQINTEISPIFKLSLKHLEVAGHERQNVKMASELFSHSVAQALLRNFPSNTVAEKFAKFIELVNNWFDTMNSYSMNGVGFKKPYGLDLDEQNAVLDEMYSTIKNMKCFNKKKEVHNGLQIFQKGILMSITSMKGLRSEMERRFGYKYILTHRANQDCLENFYSQVRYRNGASDHPTPVECLNNIKSIILGKNPGCTSTMHANTIEREPEEYASATFRKILANNDSDSALGIEVDANMGCCSGYLNEEYLEDDDLNSECDIPEQFIQDYTDCIPEGCIEEERILEDNFVDLAIECLEDNSNEEIVEYHVTDLSTECLEDHSIEISAEFLADLSTDMLIDDSNTARLKEDGLEYIAGWIAWKFKDKNSDLSKSRRESLPSYIVDHTYAKRLHIQSSSWIDSISYGGLTKPTEQVLQWVKQLEFEFLKLHGNEFNDRLNVKETLIETLQGNCEEVPKEIICLFAKSRIYMRCKYLNQKRIEEALLKKQKRRREASQPLLKTYGEDLARSKSKKMKKIVS